MTFNPLRQFIGLILVPLTSTAAFALDVRTAAQDSQPKFIKSGSTVTGLCVDVIKAIERADPDLKFSAITSLTPLPRIEASLSEGSLDVFCGLAKTKDRESRFDFIEPPVYSTHTVLAARLNETLSPKTFDELRNLGDDSSVLVVTQTVHADVLKAHPGIKVDSEAKDTSANLKKLLAGRGRFVFHNDFALADEIKRENLGDKVKLLPAQFMSEGRYFVVSKMASPALKEKLRVAMDKLNKTGELTKMFQSYKPK